MGRSPCCDETGLKKGPWTPEEDDKLVKHIQEHGHRSWRALPKLAGLDRCGKSCRLRWTNYLRPDIKRGKFSEEEEQTILNLHSILGNKWSAIAKHLPGRTDNGIKNFWNTHLKKKLFKMGFDPMTHRPRNDIFSRLPHLLTLANLKELMEHHPWAESAVRLQAEAAQVATLECLQYLLQPPTLPNISNMISNVPALESTYNNLSTSLHQTPTISSLEDGKNHQEVHDSTFFSHLPDLVQLPCNFQTNAKKDIMVEASRFNLEMSHAGESSPTPPCWLPSTSTSYSSQSPPAVAASPVTETSISCNTGDASSTPTHGGAPTAPPSFWPDLLLEDPLFPGMT
ncbi:hypothetical protein RJ639_017381 [Escallonia herrerae]|uniref:Transcription factor MYB39 n=1 Tax=Escallonia herrerae TaxID=1293975 RepID=A0AA88VG83_9ASTE|nr:hypothetical protein RJ639_017381 [Escallonia herrerae]